MDDKIKISLGPICECLKLMNIFSDVTYTETPNKTGNGKPDEEKSVVCFPSVEIQSILKRANTQTGREAVKGLELAANMKTQELFSSCRKRAADRQTVTSRGTRSSRKHTWEEIEMLADTHNIKYLD